MVNETVARPATGAEILLIDDEKYLRDILRCCLENAHFTVLAVASGEEAVAAFQQQGAMVRLVLTDLVLRGGMNGLQTMATLRQLRPNLPFCVITGDCGDKEDEVLASGPAYLFRKPFSMPDLLAAVSELLRPTDGSSDIRAEQMLEPCGTLSISETANGDTWHKQRRG